jgi:hypothetical protein
MISATYFRKPLGKTFWFGFRMIAFHLPRKFRTLIEVAVEGATKAAGYLVCNSFVPSLYPKQWTGSTRRCARIPLAESRQCHSDQQSLEVSSAFQIETQILGRDRSI